MKWIVRKGKTYRADGKTYSAGEEVELQPGAMSSPSLVPAYTRPGLPLVERRIARGKKYYKDGRLYAEGEVIEVPEGYPESSVFEPVEQANVSQALEAQPPEGDTAIDSPFAARRRGRPPLSRE